MVTQTTTRARRPPPRPIETGLERRILWVRLRYWMIAGIVLGLCLSIYEVSGPVGSSAFEQPGAQQPNRLRSPWGVQNPL